MTVSVGSRSERLRPWGVAGLTYLAIALLWWLTAGADDEAKLWRRYREWVADVNVIATVLFLAIGHVLRSSVGARRRTFQLLAVGVSTAVILVLFEVPALFFRVDYGQVFGVRPANSWWILSAGINRDDDELIFRHHPHTRYTGKVRGTFASLGIPRPALHDFDVAYDKNGFRNDEDHIRADIGVIGDSFVEAAEVPRASTMDSELGRRLGMTAVNLGQSGYGPQQELVVLKRYGIPLAPKAVVWLFYSGNDLENATDYEAWRRAPGTFRPSPTWNSRSFVRNAIRAVARRTTPERTTPSAAARRRAAEFKRHDGAIETTYLDLKAETWDPRGWDLTSASLLAARDETRAIGARFVVVYVPLKSRVYAGYVRREVPDRGQTSQPETLPDVVSKWCGQQGIEYLDATIPLRESAARGESTYLPDDDHWNAAGHRVVAAAVAERLRPLVSGTPAQNGKRP